MLSDMITPALKVKQEVKSTLQLVEEQDKRLSYYRGKEFLGLPQRTIPSLDDLLLGLRKFMLLTAGPNVGKTALTIQLGLDVIKNNQNTCLVYVSLEMSAEDIIDRMRCHLTPMTYKKLYFGSTGERSQGWYKNEELENLKISRSELEYLAPRILILTEESLGQIDAEIILQKANKIKETARCTKAIVIIDYLQVFPVPDGLKIPTEIAMDDYRIKQMKKLRIGLNNDPLIVISEARKSSGGGPWTTTSIADSKGSGRAAYTPDVGILLNPLQEEELNEIFNDKKGDEKRGQIIRESLSEQGVSILKLTIDKARDGMRKGDVLLKYYFQENRFEETSKYQLCNSYGVFLNKYPKEASDHNVKTGKYSQTIESNNDLGI